MKQILFTGHPMPYCRPLRQIGELIAEHTDDAACLAEIRELLRQYGIELPDASCRPAESSPVGTP